MSTSKLHLLFGALVALNALDGFCTLRTREFIKLRALQTECNHVNTKTATRVMGGKTAKMAHFPSFMILSMRVLQGDHVLERDCGAVIIDKQYLLTAASCLMLPEIQKIVSGTAWRTNKRPEDRKNFVGRGYAMKAFCVPATYKKDSKNDFYHDDFAVVKLSREIEFSKKAQPICLRSEPCKDCPNSYSVPGFGKTVDYKSEKGKVSFNGDLLRYVRLEDNPCEKPFNKDEFMCLSSPEHSGKTSATCEGKSCFCSSLLPVDLY